MYIVTYIPLRRISPVPNETFLRDDIYWSLIIQFKNQFKSFSVISTNLFVLITKCFPIWIYTYIDVCYIYTVDFIYIYLTIEIVMYIVDPFPIKIG